MTTDRSPLPPLSTSLSSAARPDVEPAASSNVPSDARFEALHAWLSSLAANDLAAGSPSAADQAASRAAVPDSTAGASVLSAPIPPLDLTTLSVASSDAGFRRYFRVRVLAGTGAAASADGGNGSGNDSGNDSGNNSATNSDTNSGSLIAMDAPPPEKSREFVDVQRLLSAAGVNVPRILAADVERGFMLLSDMGNTAYLAALSSGDEQVARPLMRDALRALIRWQSASRPQVLPDYDDALLRRELELFPEWYLGRHLERPADATERQALDGVFRTLIDSALAQPKIFVHRDFMPRNLMICPPSPGVLDFQDAVYGPATYDVASLFRDAFISWEESFELDCIAWYWGEAKAAGLPVRADFAEYYRELEWMGLQRHLKILGLFARLNYRDGKPRYLADTPRFLAYARKVSERYRELKPLARLLDKLENRAATVGYTF